MKTAEYYIKNRIKLSKQCKEWAESNFFAIVYVKNGKNIKSTKRKVEANRTKFVRYQKNNSSEREGYYLAVLTSNKSRIEKHLYYVYKCIVDHKEVITYSIINLTVFKNDEFIKVHQNNYRPGKCAFGLTSYGMPSYTKKYIDEVFFDNLFERKNTENYLLNPYNKLNNISFTQFEKLCKYRHILQVACKYGLSRFVYDFDTNHTDLRSINQRFLKENRKMILENNLGFRELLVYKKLMKMGIPIKNEYLKYINSTQLECIPKNISVERLLNYLLKSKKTFGYYMDYYNTMKEVGATPETEQTIYPKDIVKAHDKAVYVLNSIKKEMEEKVVSEITKELAKYEYEGNVYSVVCPKSLNDIIEEGKKLEHCVGGGHYLDGHKNKKFAIMFCRLKDKKETPLITFTYHYNCTISAIHGYKNKDESNKHFNEVEKFLNEEWLPFAKRVKKGVKKNVRKKRASEQNISAEC